MSKAIKISRGLDIHLYGEAKKDVVEKTDITEYALKPLDYIGITPKLLVDVGDRVKAGTPVYFAKEKPSVKFVAPVSGEITEIKRGAKRVIQEIRIKSDGSNECLDLGKASIAELSKEQIKEKMLESGVWAMLRQRPYSVVPNPESTPKYIIVSAFDSAPLAPDYNIIAKGQKEAMQVGVDALKKLTGTAVYLSINKETSCEDILSLKNTETVVFSGKHPYGNVSVQAEKLDPINKGERIWYITLSDLITLGKVFLEGRYDAEKIIALTGEMVKEPEYYKVRRGACIKSLVEGNVNTEKHLRYISGNVLTGTRIENDGYLGMFDSQITVIEEGDYKEGLGWMMPEFGRFSVSRTFLAGFMKCCGTKKYHVDSNLHGSQRAYVFSGEFEKVLPMDVYPMQLIKACLTKDIDRMEELGIYEVDAEDFALCEVIDVSKTEIQAIVRSGLELMRKEMGE